MVCSSRNKSHQTWGLKLCEPYTRDACQPRAKLVRPIKGSFPFRAAEERWRRRNGNGIERACKRGDMNEQSIFRAYSTEIDLFLPRGAIPVRFMTDSTSNESGWRMGGGQALATSANCWLSVHALPPITHLISLLLWDHFHCEHHMCTAPEAPTVHCLCASLGI